MKGFFQEDLAGGGGTKLKFTVEEARQLYGIENWGAGYFDINEAGSLTIRPIKNNSNQIDIKKVVDELILKGIAPPILLRFPQLLESQIREIYESFGRAIEEFHYNGKYRMAFPMKVNQRRVVIENIIAAGARYNIGLEVGSKPELLMAMAVDLPRESLIICNGFKDISYLRTAFLGRQIGKNVFVVI